MTRDIRLLSSGFRIDVMSLGQQKQRSTVRITQLSQSRNDVSAPLHCNWPEQITWHYVSSVDLGSTVGLQMEWSPSSHATRRNSKMLEGGELHYCWPLLHSWVYGGCVQTEYEEKCFACNYSLNITRWQLFIGYFYHIRCYISSRDDLM